MNRRETLAAFLAIGSAGGPLSANAQAPGKIRRIGVLQINPRKAIAHVMQALEDGLMIPQLLLLRADRIIE